MFENPLVYGAEHGMAIGIDVVRLLPSLPQSRCATLYHVEPAGETLVQNYLSCEVSASILGKIHQHVPGRENARRWGTALFFDRRDKPRKRRLALVVWNKPEIKPDRLRGLRSICERIMSDAMYEAPSSRSKTFKLTLEYAKARLG